MMIVDGAAVKGMSPVFGLGVLNLTHGIKQTLDADCVASVCHLKEDLRLHFVLRRQSFIVGYPEV